MLSIIMSFELMRFMYLFQAPYFGSSCKRSAAATLGEALGARCSAHAAV